MPPEIGCVYWRTSAEPCTSVLTPWYIGITEVPESYHKPVSIEKHLSLENHFNTPEGTFDYDLQHTWWTFRRLQDLVNSDYQTHIKKVREVWDEYENKFLADQPIIEDKALKLFSEDKAQAQSYLTNYSKDLAIKSADMANNIYDKLLS
jgi:dipeptidase